jgi:hypothetical protein
LQLQARLVWPRRFCCCWCSSLPLTYLPVFFLVIVGVPAVDGIPALLVSLLLLTSIAGVLLLVASLVLPSSLV